MAGITITLGGNFAKLDELKGKAHKTAASIKDSFSKIAGSAAFKGLAAGATVAFAGITAAMAKAISKGGELSDTMARTGASGKGLVILQKAFENAGLSANELGTSIARMQKALAGVNQDGEPTNQVFAELGLSVRELMAMDPADALMKIGDSISRITDPAKRAAAAIGLFGRSGANLNAVFVDPAALSGAATQLGGLADLLPGMAADADYVGDAFGSIGDKTTQLGAGIASELMPHLLEVSKWLNEADFTSVGKSIGEDITTLVEYFTAIGNGMASVAEKVPGFKEGVFLLEKLASLNPNAGEALPMIPGVSIGADGKGVVETPTAPAKPEAFNPFEGMREESAKIAAKEAEKAAKAAEAKAEADARTAAQAEKSRAAAAEEYRLENAILAARLKGDADRLAKLEREKAIREEIKRLESAGFTPEEARKPAVAKVDAEKKATDAEAQRQAAMDEKRKAQEVLAGKVNESRDKLENLQYQSSVGAVSSMQRIGGGGGAVASGLDYARQSSDLLRELNQGMRQLIDVSRQPIDY
jgi:hypothetical protein